MRVLVLLLAATLTGWAQRPFSIRHLTTQDGLLQGTCYYIRKDSRGFVWASSQNGLNRFDGKRFAGYRSNEQDSSTIGKGEVRGIVETPNGDLWVGTEECLNRYDRRTDSFRRIYATDRRGRSFISQHEVFFGDDSTVWYVNARQGIVRLNYRTGHRKIIDPTIISRFSLTTEWVEHDPAQRRIVYLLSHGFRSLDYRTRRSRTWLTGQVTDAPVSTRLPASPARMPVFQTVHRCRMDGPHRGNYCFVGPNGIYEFDAGLTRLIQFYPLRPGVSTYRFVSMAEDRQGRWWLAVEGSGVWIYDPAGRKILRELKPGPAKANSLLTTQVSAVYVDDLGLVWANGDPFGIDIIYPNAQTVETLPDDPADVTDLNSHPIRGLCEDRQGRIWIGTVDGGLRRYDPSTGLMRAYGPAQGLTIGANVRNIVPTRDGRLLVATVLGLFRYDARADRFTPVPNPLCSDADCWYVSGMSELPDGRFVLPTHAGLFLLDAHLKPLFLTDPGGTYYGSLHYDARTGLLYAGRRNRDLVIYQYRPDVTGPAQLTQQRATLAGYSPMAFHPDPARRCLWLCTDRGLVRFDPATQRPLRTYTVRDGLPDDVVYGLLPDRQGRYWLSTNNGLVKFFPTEEKFSPVISTQGREYNSHASLAGRDGTFYFGGVHGLDRFVPQQLETYRAHVPVRIVSFLVNDQPYRAPTYVGETNGVSLEPQERTFTIGLAALDYFSNGKNQFQYQLSGVDPAWVTLNDGSTVRYADLSPGQYVFHVRAVDARGQLTPVTRLRIRIRPPFWQRWWFWTVLVLVTVGTVAFSVNAYNRQKLARQRRLLRNTLATQEDERRRIARDLHDDVGNTLAAAKGLLERAKANVAAAADLPDLTQAYNLIEKAGTDLRTITHDLMPVEFERYALPDVMAQLVERANRSSATDFEFIQFGEVRRLKPERELVTYRIIAELIQNALKHGGPGLAIVQLGYHARHLSVLVETPVVHQQSNLFFSEQMTPGIGQKNITYRAEYLRATLTTDSNTQSHIVMLDVPYDSTAYSTR